MRRMNLRATAVAALALLTVPALAQNFSDGFSFLKGVRERDAPKVQELVSNPNPAIINYRDASSGEGALHILVRGRDRDWLSFMLSRGARPDLQSNDGTTPLILAAQVGWREGAELLLSRRANPNLGNRNGETALMFAVQRRDVQMIRLLRSQGADPNQSDNVTGNSALDLARQDSRSAHILRELE